MTTIKNNEHAYTLNIFFLIEQTLLTLIKLYVEQLMTWTDFNQTFNKTNNQQQLKNTSKEYN